MPARKCSPLTPSPMFSPYRVSQGGSRHTHNQLLGIVLLTSEVIIIKTTTKKKIIAAMQNHDFIGLSCSETHMKIRCLPRTSYNLFEVTTSQGDERDDVIHLTNLWLPSTDLAVLIQGRVF